MSSKYKVHDQTCPYFVTYATIGWADVFTRTPFRNILLESLDYCAASKGLLVYAWCLMTNHVHLIIGTEGKPIAHIMRATISVILLKLFIKHYWWKQKAGGNGYCPCSNRRALPIAITEAFSYGSRIIILLRWIQEKSWPGGCIIPIRTR